MALSEASRINECSPWSVRYENHELAAQICDEQKAKDGEWRRGRRRRADNSIRILLIETA